MPAPTTTWSSISEETIEISWSDLIDTSGSSWGSGAWGLGPLGAFKWSNLDESQSSSWTSV